MLQQIFSSVVLTRGYLLNNANIDNFKWAAITVHYPGGGDCGTGDQGDDADLVHGDNDYNAVDGEADTYEVGVVTGEILLQQQKVRGAYKYSLDLW